MRPDTVYTAMFLAMSNETRDSAALSKILQRFLKTSTVTEDEFRYIKNELAYAA